MNILEPERKIPVICEADVCVVGGGCAGVSAALKAARAGARVVILERGNCFGGTAVQGLVNVWHSLYDTDYREQIIHGITEEIEALLLQDGAAAVENNESAGIRFNPFRLAVIYDRLILKENIKVYFHTYYAGMVKEDGRITAVLVENKDGRGAVRAGFFIDATGDGDLCRDAGLEAYTHPYLQPPSSCSFLQNVPEKPFDIGVLVKAHGAEFGLEDDWGWGGIIPGLPSLTFRADNHVFGVNCANADALTKAEFEGRKKSAAVSDLLKKYVDPGYELAALCASIGIRETVHYRTNYCVTDDDLLLGKRFPHTVMRGTYRLDRHHEEDNGITFKYLDGRTDTFYGKDTAAVHGNWRAERGITQEPAKYYCAPFEMLVQDKIANLIPVGRMMNAEAGAFGALRVMVNLNQLGEAAGTAAVIALDEGISINAVDGGKVVEKLETAQMNKYNKRKEEEELSHDGSDQSKTDE